MTQSGTEQQLSQFRIFEGFSQEELERIAQFVHEEAFPAGSILFKQGSVPDAFYLLDSGAIREVGTDPDGKDLVRRRAEAGDYIGHRALLHDEPHETTAEALADTHVLVVHRADFQTLLAMYPRLHRRLQRVDVVNRLLAIPLFAGFSERELFRVADLVHVVEFPARQVVFAQGEQADAFYVIDTGQVIERASDNVPGKQTWPKYLAAGSFFGRYALLNDRPRRATAEAVTDVRLFRLSADSFHWLRKLKPSFERGLERHDVLAHLRRLDIFAELREEELKQLAGYVGLAHYRPSDVLYRQGEFDPTLYILYEGEAIIRVRDAEGRERPIGYLQPKDAVGEASLFLKEPRDVTVESTTDGNWFYLTRQDLDLFLDHYPGLADKVIPREEVERRWRWTRPPWMEPDEQLIWLGRRHSFYLSSRLSLPLFLLLMALILLILPGLPNILGYAILVAAVFWAGWSFVDWYNDYYAITTARAVHREKVVLIRETRDETPLNKIQNINIQQGLVGNTFGFGTLLIDTAAAAGASRVTFDYLGEPRQVQELLFGQIRRARAGERLEMRRVIRDKLEESVGPSIRPNVPKPAVGAPSSPPAPPPQSGPPAVQRIYDATLGRYFWIEKRVEKQIIWRKHWIRLLQRIWLPALVTLGLILVLIASSVALGAGSLWLDLFLVGLLMLSLGWLWWSWEDWGNDLYIVTDDRIIDTEARPLGFGSTRTETTFDRIQNVSFDIPSPVATFFDYGTVIIYTAGAQGRLDFDWVQGPKRVQREIFRRLTAYEERQRQRDQEDRWADLPQWFAVYERNYRS